MEDIKEYFNKNNIPYNDIDENIKILVYCFNKIGLTTEFSCEGHKNGECPTIIFTEEVNDVVIDKYMHILSNGEYIGEFKQWIRSRDPNNKENKNYILKNYMFTIDSALFNQESKCDLINNAIRIICEMYKL